MPTCTPPVSVGHGLQYSGDPYAPNVMSSSPGSDTVCYSGPKVAAVVVAAGSSARMGGIDKIFVPVLGLPLVAYSLDQLERCPSVDRIALVLDARSLEQGADLVRERGYRKVVQLCPGGKRRQDSVYNGLEAVAGCEWVIVHDGARPCLDDKMLRRGLGAAQECGAAVAGVQCKDTIKVVSTDMKVQDTPDRATLWMAQTPQVFRYRLLLDAHRRCDSDVTDDATMVESLGYPVKMFLGAYENLKVTTPDDLILAEVLLCDRAAARP